MSDQKADRENRTESACDRGAEGTRVCPVCRGETLIEIRGKLQCERCHTPFARLVARAGVGRPLRFRLALCRK